MWVVNAEGVYIENRPYHSYLEDDILTAINEKYGTNFSSLTYLREPSIAIGDDCPDWDAYEKIEMPSVYVAVYPTSSSVAYIAGKVKGEIFTILANTENSSLIINGNGIVNTIYGPPPTMQALSYAIGNLADNGITVTQTNAEISTLGVGDSVPNWNEYSVI